MGLLKNAEEHDDEQSAIEAQILAEDLKISIEQAKLGIMEAQQKAAPIGGVQPAQKQLSLLPPSGSIESPGGMPQTTPAGF